MHPDNSPLVLPRLAESMRVVRRVPKNPLVPHESEAAQSPKTQSRHNMGYGLGHLCDSVGRTVPTEVSTPAFRRIAAMPAPVTLAPMRRLTFAGKQQDRSNRYCTPAKRWPFCTAVATLIAYPRSDDSLSCLGCVTDWQQKTRGLFLSSRVGRPRCAVFAPFVTSEQESFLLSVQTMLSPNTHSLRVVVQNVRARQRSLYRLVANGGEGGDYTCRSAGFESLDRLLKVLHSAVPDFDESTLSTRMDTIETYIAFVGEMELSASQLSLLGLKDSRRS